MKTLSISLIILSMLLYSCSDELLDIEPKDQLTDIFVWSSPENANLFLNDIYNNLNPGQIGRAHV